FERTRLKPLTNIAFYCVCFIGQFFMENTTLFNSMMLIIAIAIQLFLYRQWNPKYIVGLLLSVLGTVIMFLNPKYRKIFLEGSDYQQISSDTGMLDKIYKTMTTTITEWVFFNQIIILSIIIIVISFMLYINAMIYKTSNVKMLFICDYILFLFSFIILFLYTFFIEYI